MKSTAKLALLIMFLLVTAGYLFVGEISDQLSPYVDNKGNITMPEDFRSVWSHLGTWVVTSNLAAGINLNESAHGVGFHNVYTQSESLKAYKRDGKWPNGTVLIMEIRAIKWDDLPTGHVIVSGDPLKWFIMIKDTTGRYQGNFHWGNGWGWALFKPDNPVKNISKDFKKDCVECHDSARETDMVFVQGYPPLREK